MSKPLTTDDLRDYISHELFTMYYDSLDRDGKRKVDSLMALAKRNVDYVIGEDETGKCGYYCRDVQGSGRCKKHQSEDRNTLRAEQRNRGGLY